MYNNRFESIFQDTGHSVYGNGDTELTFVSNSSRNTGYNLIKVNIYYQHLNLMKIDEEKEYGVGLAFNHINMRMNIKCIA